MVQKLFQPISVKFALVVIILLECIWAAYLFHLSGPGPKLGFLVKDKNAFIVVWRTEESGIQFHREDSLNSAVKFAADELNLSVGRNPIADQEVEYLNLADRHGTFQLFWKLSQVNFLNQITFQKSSDAQFFAQAFHAGAYSPSPFGHSILLLPIRR